jgi:hypothetical protein
MRKFTLALFALTMSVFTTNAQVVANFDTFSVLTTYPDTAYINYSQPNQNVGFNDGQAFFPCVYDTSWGGLWNGGFAYSNMTDSITTSYLNQYSAKTAAGYNASAGYAVYWNGYTPTNYIKITDTAAQGDTVLGFYATNTTYGYNTMRDGDFIAKKFGGIPNVDSDWYRLTVYGYLNGVQKADTVDFYLADFRSNDSTQDYIVNTWEWVDLTSLGNVDSISFALNSTDTAGGFGMNNPAYFALDNFTTKTTTPDLTGVKSVATTHAAKIYPNPATNVLYVEVNNSSIKTLNIVDVTGRIVLTQTVSSNREAINTSSLQSGTYFLQLSDGRSNYSSRFVKQ